MNKNQNIKLLILDVDGTMTDGGIYILDDGRQFKKFSAKDGLGIKMALQKGVEVGIISHSMVSEMVETRAHMLGLNYCYVGDEPKLNIFNQWMQKMDLKKEEIAFIGDDLNDSEIMKEVGFSACPSDSVEEIKGQVDVVLSKKGGEGAVREFIDKYIL